MFINLKKERKESTDKPSFAGSSNHANPGPSTRTQDRMVNRPERHYKGTFT